MFLISCKELYRLENYFLKEYRFVVSHVMLYWRWSMAFKKITQWWFCYGRGTLLDNKCIQKAWKEVRIRVLEIVHYRKDLPSGIAKIINGSTDWAWKGKHSYWRRTGKNFKKQKQKLLIILKLSSLNFKNNLLVSHTFLPIMGRYQ